ncbi:polysacchardie deacetylase domain-containing protein [Alicycliphilus sp. B1]|nr:polysacchardie deacetylase domain-containing protein [Alicycliphilus sp. B1]
MTAPTSEKGTAPDSPAPDRCLCICADDFGMSQGINAAVFELASRGKISATGCMVNRGAWSAGIAGLRGLDPTHVDVGLHLDFSRPDPIDAPERGLANFIAKAYLGLLQPAQVRAEIKDQLTRFEDGLGRPPAFVDGHRHVHQLPTVSDMLIEELVARYGAALAWVRNTAPPETSRWPMSKADVIFLLGGRRLLKQAARKGVPVSRGLLGVYGFTGDSETYRSRLERWIGDSRTGHVLMCHPSLGDMSGDPIGAARRQEYAVLSAVAFPYETNSGSVVLGPFSRQLVTSGNEAHINL